MKNWKKVLAVSWGIMFIHGAAMAMIGPFLPLYVKDLGITDPKAQSLWSGILFGSTFLVTALMGPLWGTISDKYGRRPLILRTTFAFSIVALLMSLATNVYQVLFLRILHGIFGGVLPAFIALVAANLPEDKTGQGLGAMQTATLSGRIIGPFIGGLLYDWMGYRYVLLSIAVITFLAGVATLLFITEPKRDAAKIRATVMSNIRLVMSSRHLKTVAIIMFAIQFSLFIVQPILPLFIVSLYGQGNSATMVGLIFSVTGFSTLLFAPFRGKAGDKKGHISILSKSLLFAGIAFIPQAFVTSVYQLLPLRAIIGFFVAGIVPSSQSIIVKNTDDAQRGGVLGITHSVTICGQAIGPLVGGALGAVFGYRFPFIITAFLLVSLWWFLRTFMHTVDPLPQRAHGEPEQ
jgi:MFS transporter, DHA1 family, multidrug resistance protein